MGITSLLLWAAVEGGALLWAACRQRPHLLVQLLGERAAARACTPAAGQGRSFCSPSVWRACSAPAGATHAAEGAGRQAGKALPLVPNPPCPTSAAACIAPCRAAGEARGEAAQQLVEAEQSVDGATLAFLRHALPALPLLVVGLALGEASELVRQGCGCWLAAWEKEACGAWRQL